VVELGLPGPTLHQVDEHVRTADIEELTRVYEVFVARFFAGVVTRPG